MPDIAFADPVRPENPQGFDLADFHYVDLRAHFGDDLPRLPYALRILAENALRTSAPADIAAAVSPFIEWLRNGTTEAEIGFLPGRVLMHDTTCTPAIADIAAMRDNLAARGIDPSRLNPVIAVDVSVDHSLAVDAYAMPGASAQNLERELARNAERYGFLKWATQALGNVRVHAPGTGIMHTMNLEQLSSIIAVEQRGGQAWLMPDTLLGTDSHTPMVNGIGVMGWGIGGLEAESVLFGLPVTLRLPEVVGVRLTGALAPGVSSTDLALTVTQMLRKKGVAGAFVEFFGPGVAALTAGDRAVVANMAPEYGATTGYFPIDAASVAYLRQTGRPDSLLARVEPASRAIGLWFDPAVDPQYSSTLSLDLATLQTSLAGPQRPQDRIAPQAARAGIEAALCRPLKSGATPPDGAVAIAAITSCTNTSDPRLVITAALLARKARGFGLRPKPWVKTSFAPGSPSAADYLQRAGLLDDLSAMGFDIVGFGCTTCIGNSGALPNAVVQAAAEGRAMVAVLSGNRNFPGRVHPDLTLGYLASPALVIAHAIAGEVLPDIQTDTLGHDLSGRPVTLADIWPAPAEVEAALQAAMIPADIPAAFATADASPAWRALPAPTGAQFPWQLTSRSLRPPAFVTGDTSRRLGIYTAAPLLVLGDDITTDHISPAGRIDRGSEAGKWLIAQGADPSDLNVFASYRGNWEVMLRGLFTNSTVRNLLAPDAPPGFARHPHGGTAPLWQAAAQHAKEGTSVVVIAGERYGMGSSRDWAAKGVALLGVRAVLARSFERIHRTNLIGMGILPVEIPPDMHPDRLSLGDGDHIEIHADPTTLAPRCVIQVRVKRADDSTRAYAARAAVETAAEVAQLRSGGIIPMILDRIR